MAAETEGEGRTTDMRQSGIRNLLNLDIIFRAAIGAAFAYMIYGALQMPETSFGRPAAYPLFVGVIGLALWFAHAIYQVIMTRSGKIQGRIYDIAFETEGMTPRTVWLRTLWTFGIMGSLLLGVWLLNFHITIPLFLFLYLWLVGKAKVRSAALLAFGMLLPVAFLYGSVINTSWPESVLESVLGIEFQDFFDFIFHRVF